MQAGQDSVKEEMRAVKKMEESVKQEMRLGQEKMKREIA
ncbi:hypothetical protein X975_21728, partial [Stegodyphus mimosarum]